MRYFCCRLFDIDKIKVTCQLIKQRLSELDEAPPLAVLPIPYGEETAMVIALVLAVSGVVGLYRWCAGAAKRL